MSIEETRQLLLDQMSEAEFQIEVIRAARTFGWRIAHFRAAQNRRGQWETPVQADGKGFPDLVLVRAGRLIFAELKRNKGSHSPEQKRWLEDLEEVATQIHVPPDTLTVRTWRPRDWDQILEVLK